MSRLSLTNTTVPDTFQSMFRQMVQPWRMADDIDDSRVKASYVDGVLQLELPKKASSVARKVAIQ